MNKTFYGKSPMGNPAPVLVQMLQGRVDVNDSINYRMQKFNSFCFWYGEREARKYGMMDKFMYMHIANEMTAKAGRVFMEGPLLPR